MPVLFPSHSAGDILPAADWQSAWTLAESSFNDVGPLVITGLVPSAGTGLAINITAGTALFGAEVTYSSFSITGLTNATTNHLYALQGGTGTSNTTGTPPANSVKLGTAVTAGGVVTSVDTNRSSGRQIKVRTESLVPGGPGAGNPASIDLSQWAASAANSVTVFGTLPAGAVGGVNAPLTVTLNDANQNSVQTSLTVSHTYNAGGGATGIGVAVDLVAESATNGTTKVVSSLQAALTDATSGSATGRLSVNVIANNAQVTPLTVAGQDIRIPQAAASNSQRGLLNIGNGGFDGSAGHFSGQANGALIALNEATGFTGTLIQAQVNGVDRFVLWGGGTINIPTAPQASGNFGVWNLGDGGFSGGGGSNFAGSANGTYLAVNAASGATARLMDLQVAGVSKVLCGVGGVLTVSNKVATNGLQVGQATKTGNYTLLTTDYQVFGDATGGAFTVTLPTASSGTGQIYSIIKTDAVANNVTVQGNGAELINAANTYLLTTQFQSVTIISNGTKWFVI